MESLLIKVTKQFLYLLLGTSTLKESLSNVIIFSPSFKANAGPELRLAVRLVQMENPMNAREQTGKCVFPQYITLAQGKQILMPFTRFKEEILIEEDAAAMKVSSPASLHVAVKN